MKNHNHLRVSARSLRATAGGNAPPWKFGGVAVAAGDILHMDDGTRVLFTAEELKKAAETQAGEPLTKDHPSDEQGNPAYPPPTDDTVGRVESAGWVDDLEAVGYEAVTHDDDVGRGVQANSYDVSVHPRFELGEYREEKDAYVAENIRFQDLSVVSKGDSPSNTAEYGPNEALASWTVETDDIGSELTASADGAGDTPDRESLIASTIKATLGALGISPDSETVEADLSSDVSDEGPQQSEDDSAESSGNDAGGNSGVDDANTDTDDSMTDPDTDDTDDADGQDGDSKTIAEMTVDELGSALRDQGFVTEDDAADLVASVQGQLDKADKVDEIIAASDEYGDDDREDLMASADKVVENEYDRVTGSSGQRLPGGASARSEIEASFSSDDDGLDEYGVGVADNL